MAVLKAATTEGLFSICWASRWFLREAAETWLLCGWAGLLAVPFKGSSLRPVKLEHEENLEVISLELILPLPGVILFHFWKIKLPWKKTNLLC